MHVGVRAVKLKLQRLQLTLPLGNLEFMCLHSSAFFIE